MDGGTYSFCEGKDSENYSILVAESTKPGKPLRLQQPRHCPVLQIEGNLQGLGQANRNGSARPPENDCLVYLVSERNCKMPTPREGPRKRKEYNTLLHIHMIGLRAIST